MWIILIVIPCVVAALRESLTEALATFFTALLKPLQLAAAAIDEGRRPPRVDRKERKASSSVPLGSGPIPLPTDAKLQRAIGAIGHFAIACTLAALFVTMFVADIFVNALRFIGLFELRASDERIAMLTERADLLSGASLACVAATYGLFLFDAYKFSTPSFFDFDAHGKVGRIVRWLAVAGFLASLVLAGVFFYATQLRVAFGDEAFAYGYARWSLIFTALYGVLLIGALAIAGVAVPHVLLAVLLVLIGSTRLLLAATIAILDSTGKLVGVAVDAVATVGDVEVSATTKVWNAAVDLVASDEEDNRRNAVRNLRIGGAPPPVTEPHLQVVSDDDEADEE